MDGYSSFQPLNNSTALFLGKQMQFVIKYLLLIQRLKQVATVQCPPQRNTTLTMICRIECINVLNASRLGRQFGGLYKIGGVHGKSLVCTLRTVVYDTYEEHRVSRLLRPSARAWRWDRHTPGPKNVIRGRNTPWENSNRVTSFVALYSEVCGTSNHRERGYRPDREYGHGRIVQNVLDCASCKITLFKSSFPLTVLSVCRLYLVAKYFR